MKTKKTLLSILCILTQVFFAVNLKSQAIHQLEVLTGQQIDRGYGNSDIPSTYRLDEAAYSGEFKDIIIQEAGEENNKGIENYNNKEWAKAIRHFRTARKLNSDDNNIKNNLDNAIKQLEKQKKIKQYEKEYKKVDKVFLTYFNNNIKANNKLQEKLRKNIMGIVPPLTEVKKTIHEGIILGLFNTQVDNSVNSLSLRSPFTNKLYKPDEYFATTDNTTNKELVRGVIDNNYLGKYTLNTKYGKELVEKLNGTHFDRLIAHSNGATVSEALIREGIITVDELNVIGGDRSYVNYFGYNELIASGKVKRVVVWLNPGDIIPMGSSSLLLTPTVADKDKYVKNFAAFINYKLTGTGAVNDHVRYRYLKGPQYKRGQDYYFGEDFLGAHGIDAYFENMKTFFGKNDNGSANN